MNSSVAKLNVKKSSRVTRNIAFRSPPFRIPCMSPSSALCNDGRAKFLETLKLYSKFTLLVAPEDFNPCNFCENLKFRFFHRYGRPGLRPPQVRDGLPQHWFPGMCCRGSPLSGDSRGHGHSRSSAPAPHVTSTVLRGAARASHKASSRSHGIPVELRQHQRPPTLSYIPRCKFANDTSTPTSAANAAWSSRWFRRGWHGYLRHNLNVFTFLRSDVVVVHQHLINNNEAARTVPDDADTANDGDLSVASRILSPSVSHELELFPEHSKSPPECVQLEQWRFSDEALSAVGSRGGLLERHQHQMLSFHFCQNKREAYGGYWLGGKHLP